jgi:uncharacterized protein (DUF736 family)
LYYKKKPLVKEIKALFKLYNQTKNKMETKNKNNTAVLFKNDSTTENAPNYKGKIFLNDKEFYFDCWVKKSKTGVSYMSLSVGLEVGTKQTSSPVKAVESEDLPF